MSRKGLFLLQSDSRVSTGSHKTSSLLSRFFALVLLLGVSAQASADLSISLIAWGTIGLDSNNVNVGPNKFPVGARVCSESGDAASTADVTFDFDDGNDNFTGDPYINLRSGTLDVLTLDVPANGGCVDAYYEVELTRDANAYENTRAFTITADDGSTSASTPTPRQIYIEHLVSQDRNDVTDVKLDGVSIPEGGTMTLVVGQTYDITLVSSTAPQGYEQIETFINFPNIIFKINSVQTTYSSGGVVDKLYGDGCTWDDDPNSANYQSCLSTGKLGGNVVTTEYNVTILSVPSNPLSNPVALDSLIYDKSGSSFHYNSDFGATRYANIVTTSIDKQFSPNIIDAGGTSTLTFSIHNPGPDPIADVNFVDNLPPPVEIEGTTVTYTNCGTAPPSPPSLIDGATSLSFTDLEIAGGGTCTIQVTVTIPAPNDPGTFVNTTGNLFIGTFDTGDNATDVLTILAPPVTCTTPTTMATWNFTGATIPPATVPPSSKAGDVSGGAASGVNGTPSIGAGNPNPGLSLSSSGWLAATGAPTPAALATLPYFQFSVDSTNYGSIQITLDHSLVVNGTWASNSNDHAYIFSSANGVTYTLAATVDVTKGSFKSEIVDAVAALSGPTTTYFRITFDTLGPNPTLPTPVLIDNVVIEGCPRTAFPTMSKTFADTQIEVGETTTLTFSFANPNDLETLTGVGFTDALPGGLEVGPGEVTSAVTCSPGSISGQTVTAVQGTNLISLSGATLVAGSVCSFSVEVLGAAAGSYDNVTSRITSAETGPNPGGSNVAYGEDDLDVILGPVIAKVFNPASILTGENSTLTFNITNPNPTLTLTGVSFMDQIPVGVDVVPSGPTTVCSDGSVTAADGSPDTVTLTAAPATTGLTLTPGAFCMFSVDVTGTTADADPYVNSVTVHSNEVPDGNTATANLLVSAPVRLLSLLKQVGPTATGPWTNFMATSVGSEVWYRFTIENIGDIALTGITLTDPDLDSLTPDTGDCVWEDGDGDLIGGAPFGLPVAGVGNDDHIAVCVLGPYTATDPGLQNTATAHATNTPDDSDTAEYAITSLSLVKTATPQTYSSVGDMISYEYLVTNTGSASLLAPVTVADNKATVTCPDPPAPDTGNLDPGESVTCTATYEITSADLDLTFVTNVATASADGIESNQDTETVYATPTAVIINKIELQPVLVGNFLSGIVADGLSSSGTSTDGTSTDGLLALLSAWDPARAASLSDADSQTILDALEQYLDPDGDGQVAVLRWDTLEERGTMGFYVERKQGDNDWARINDDMLPGLIVAPEGGEYQLADPGAQAGQQYQYRLIEQEVRGAMRTYGPFNVEMKP